jgi:hypothetical protein
MLPELTREEVTGGLDGVVDEILAEAGVLEPPVDAIAVARSLEVSLALDDRQKGRARYVRLGDRQSGGCQAAILLRPEPRRERRQWAVAHEIGEHVAHRLFARWGVDLPEIAADARERAANWLAGRLLLPTAWFEADAAACGWDLLALKSRYATASHELIARRMLECLPPVIITIFDGGRVTFRRSNATGWPPPPSPAEIGCQSRAHDSGRPSIVRQGSGIIWGWPIHEEGWRREILRTELGHCGLDGD